MNLLNDYRKGMRRDDIVPYYVDLIKRTRHDSPADKKEIVAYNQLIMSVWSNSALVYIKEKAWKEIGKLSAKSSKTHERRN